MQRPRRIVVFGVLCLLVGGLTGLKNTAELVFSAIGPAGIEQMVTYSERAGRPLTKSQQEDMGVHIRTLRKPVYRVGQGIESFASAVMSLVLMVTGVSLLWNRAWSLKLARWWAYYAIPAGAVSVVLSVRYMLPEMPDATSAGMVFSGVLMLVVAWTLPVLLLTQLPIDTVRQYLSAHQARRSANTTMPRPQPPTTPTAPPHTPPQPSAKAASPAPAAAPAPPTPAAETTWRDDPWNDPSSQ